MTLFLMNAVAGRVWCGYLCPQTVWTDLFQAIERWTKATGASTSRASAADGPPTVSRGSAPKHFSG